MKKKKYYSMFYLLTFSPWPFFMSFYLMFLMISFLKMFMKQGIYWFIFWLFMTMLILFQWWRDVIRESFYLGSHSLKMIKSMKLGMMLFILSEIMFFMSFFWAYFHSYLSPVIEIGMLWYPKTIYGFNPLGVPLFNTIILLCSGMLITLTHLLLILNEKYMSMECFLFTMFFGFMFSYMQLNEYKESMFMINDSIYGSIFFMLTGFHGLHVIIGTLFMIITYLRMFKDELSTRFHLCFDFCAWYWHFVDVVWLLVYFFLYFLYTI